MKLKELEKIVELGLQYKNLRDDDFQLWVFVAQQMNSKYDLYGSKLLTTMRNAKKLGLPPFESVTRCRRKLQATHPELCSEKVQKARANKQEEFREYAREL